jgi:hypothetical protein
MYGGWFFLIICPYKKIPVFDQNLHKNIFWRKMDQSLVGDTMKRKKWSCLLQWLQTLLEWARNGSAGGGGGGCFPPPAGVISCFSEIAVVKRL